MKTRTWRAACWAVIVMSLALVGPVAGQESEPATATPSAEAAPSSPAGDAPPTAEAPTNSDAESSAATPADGTAAAESPSSTEAAPPSTAPAETSEAAPAKDLSFLEFVYNASPWLFWIIVGLFIYLFATIILGFLSIRNSRVIPPKLVSQLDALLKEKKFKEGYELLKTNATSPFANAVRSGVENLSSGWDAAMDSMLTTVEDTKIRFEHRISPVAVLGQLGPMIGLFGTVIGMILAFMSLSTGEQVKSAKLASEIAIALCATLEGLTLALPAIWFYAVLKNMVHRLVFELESVAESYLRRFSQAVKK